MQSSNGSKTASFTQVPPFPPSCCVPATCMLTYNDQEKENKDFFAKEEEHAQKQAAKANMDREA